LTKLAQKTLDVHERISYRPFRSETDFTVSVFGKNLNP
jgi:hypothetical protein